MARKETRDEDRDMSGQREELIEVCRKVKYGRANINKGIGDKSDPEPKKPGLQSQ